MKESISKVKRQPSEWEKIIANEATDKELISKIYKQLLKLNSRKINDPIKKWTKGLNKRDFCCHMFGNAQGKIQSQVSITQEGSWAALSWDL